MKKLLWIITVSIFSVQGFTSQPTEDFKHFELTEQFKQEIKSKNNKDFNKSDLLQKAWELIKNEGLKQANKLTEDILEYNKYSPLGKFNTPSIGWSSGVNAGFGVTVGRRVEPTLSEQGETWQVYDELNIHVSAYAFLSEQRDLGKIKITDKNLGLYAGVFYTRTYNYIHFTDSYLSGLTKNFDKLFLSFNYFRDNNFLKIASDEVISKSDNMTARIGLAIQTPSVYFISGYGRGTIYSSKLTTLTYHKAQNSKALKVTKLISKPKGTSVQIGLQADFYGLLTLTLMGAEYSIDITKSNATNMELSKSEMDSIKRNAALSNGFKELNNGKDPKEIAAIAKFITSTEKGNRITEEMKLFILRWGKHKGSFTENITFESNGDKDYFFRHGQERVKLNKSWWDGVFNANKVNKYRSRNVENMSFEYKATNPTTPFEEIHLDKDAPISFRISKQFHAKKDGSYYRGRAVAMIKNFQDVDQEVLTSLDNQALHAPLLVDLHAQVGNSGVKRMMDLSVEELKTSFELFCNGSNAVKNCLKALNLKITNLSHEYHTQKTVSLYELKRFLQTVTTYTETFQDLKALFGESNIQLNGFLESSTQDQKMFKTYFVEGQNQGSGVIKDFIKNN